MRKGDMMGRLAALPKQTVNTPHEAELLGLLGEVQEFIEQHQMTEGNDLYDQIVRILNAK